MVLTAVTNEEVSGKTSKELTDADVLTVLSKEAKKRKEATVAYQEAGRDDLAAREIDEFEILETYLPEQLSDEEVAEIVADAIKQSGATGPQGMGAVMKIVQPAVKGRADGGRVAALVKAALTQ